MKRFNIPSLNETIDEFGWIITGVPGGAIYTVGLIDKFDHPELMIHGLHPLQSDGILRCALELIKAGHSFKISGELHDEVIANYPTKSVVVDPSNFPDWLGQAFTYHGWDTAVIQLLWPDKSGKFPGDPGYDQATFDQGLFSARVEGYDDIECTSTGCTCAKCRKPI